MFWTTSAHTHYENIWLLLTKFMREKTSKCIGKFVSESFDICLVFHSVTNRRVPTELLALAIGVPARLITMSITLSVVLGNRFVGWFLKVMRTK